MQMLTTVDCLSIAGGDNTLGDRVNTIVATTPAFQYDNHIATAYDTYQDIYFTHYNMTDVPLLPHEAWHIIQQKEC